MEFKRVSFLQTLRPGGPLGCTPTGMKAQGDSDTDHARQRPPRTPLPSSLVNGPVGSMQKPLSLGTVPRDCLPIILGFYRLQEHAFILLLLLRSICTRSGRSMTAGAPPPCSHLLFPALLPVQALCENLLWPPPDWGWASGAWNTVLHLLTKDKPLQNHIQFSI